MQAVLILRLSTLYKNRRGKKKQIKFRRTNNSFAAMKIKEETKEIS